MTSNQKVAIVTGAARGIGAAIARTLARDGARVVVVDVPAAGEQLTKVANEIRGTALQLDITADDATERIVQHVRERYGRLDVVIHNAGALWWKGVADTPADRFDLVMGVNARGAHLLAHHALPHLKAAGGGHVLVMSPPIIVDAVPGKSAYMTSKFGMTLCAMAIAAEHHHDGIAANALWPETLVESAATVNYRIGNPQTWYKAELVADAALAVLRTPPSARTGQALLCMEVLREAGVIDFVPYRCDPDHEPPVLAGAFKLPAVGGKTRSDGRI